MGTIATLMIVLESAWDFQSRKVYTACWRSRSEMRHFQFSRMVFHREVLTRGSYTLHVACSSSIIYSDSWQN